MLRQENLRQEKMVPKESPPKSPPRLSPIGHPFDKGSPPSKDSADESGVFY